MNDSSRWPLDQDPPRDDALARVLRAADEPAVRSDVDWERLHAGIMRRAASAPVVAPPGDWWDVVVRWRRLAVAASIAAILAAAALLWRTESTGVGPSLANAAPEAVALARVVAAYPDEAVLTSMLEADDNDEFTSWDGK